MSRTARAEFASTYADGVALHYQIATLLRSAILAGHYHVGEHLPGEHDLCAQFGVSRATVRRALQTLDSERLIERHPGRGTVVLPRPAVIEGPPMRQSLRSIERQARVTTARVLSLGDERPTPAAASALGLPDDAVVRTVTRVRFAGDVPLRHMVTAIPLPLGLSFTAAGLERMAIHEALARAGSPVDHASDEIGAALATPAVAATLGLRVGDPLLEVARTMYDRDGGPIAHQLTLASPAIMKVRITMAGDVHD
jgi:GntR family transcriptional regulator